MEEKKAGTKDAILASARELFWKHGFRRVTVDEICNRSGISKMTFYRYFTNKTELAKAVFFEAANEGYNQFRIIMNEPVSPEEKINRILLMKFEGTHEISIEFLNDFYHGKDKELHEYVISCTNEAWKNVLAELKIARDKGIFRKDLNLEFFFLMSQRIVEMMNDEKIMNLFSNPQEMIMECARMLLYGISPRNK